MLLIEGRMFGGRRGLGLVGATLFADVLGRRMRLRDCMGIGRRQAAGYPPTVERAQASPIKDYVTIFATTLRGGVYSEQLIPGRNRSMQYRRDDWAPKQ